MKGGVFRHRVHAGRDDALRIGKEGAHVFGAAQVGQRMVALRHDALAVHHLQPAHLGEQFLAFAEDPAIAPEQLDLVLPVRRVSSIVAAILPERRVVALAWPCSAG